VRLRVLGDRQLRHPGPPAHPGPRAVLRAPVHPGGHRRTGTAAARPRAGPPRAARSAPRPRGRGADRPRPRSRPGTRPRTPPHATRRIVSAVSPPTPAPVGSTEPVRRLPVLDAEVDDGILLVDPARVRAHGLNRSAAAVWRATVEPADV